MSESGDIMSEEKANLNYELGYSLREGTDPNKPIAGLDLYWIIESGSDLELWVKVKGVDFNHCYNESPELNPKPTISEGKKKSDLEACLEMSYIAASKGAYQTAVNFSRMAMGLLEESEIEDEEFISQIYYQTGRVFEMIGHGSKTNKDKYLKRAASHYITSAEGKDSITWKACARFGLLTLYLGVSEEDSELGRRYFGEGFEKLNEAVELAPAQLEDQESRDLFSEVESIRLHLSAIAEKTLGSFLQEDDKDPEDF